MKDNTLLAVIWIGLFAMVAAIFIFGDSPGGGECKCEHPSPPTSEGRE